MDNVPSSVTFTACAACLIAASGPAYEARSPMRLVEALTLAVAIGAIVLGCRLSLFLITLYLA